MKFVIQRVTNAKCEVDNQITGHTELIGLLAYPIRHSQSPATHNAAYEKLGVDIVNLAFEVDAPELEDAIKGLRALKMRGANVSMPRPSRSLRTQPTRSASHA